MKNKLQYSNLIRKKDKGWQYVITYKNFEGKWKTKSKQGFKKQSEARDAMDIAIADLKKSFKNGSYLKTEVTFKEFCNQYLEHISLHRTTNTVLDFKTVINAFEDLWDKELSKINKLDVQKIVDKKSKEILNKTLKAYTQTLKTIFLAARDDYELIGKLPFQKLKIGRSEPVEKRALSEKETAALLDFFKGYKKNTDYYYICLIALKAGLRLGEIMGLTWDNINFKTNEITINKQWKTIGMSDDPNNPGKKKHIWGFGTPKSKNSFRTIPMGNILQKELQRLSEENKIESDNVINFTKTKTQRRLFERGNTDSVSICLNKLFRDNHFNITVHELRHTFATNLLQLGVNNKKAAEILGHTEQELLRSYSHVNDEIEKQAKKLILERF